MLALRDGDRCFENGPETASLTAFLMIMIAFFPPFFLHFCCHFTVPLSITLSAVGSLLCKTGQLNHLVVAPASRLFHNYGTVVTHVVERSCRKLWNGRVAGRRTIILLKAWRIDMGKLRNTALRLGEGPTEFFYFNSLREVFKGLIIKPDYPKHTTINDLNSKIAEGIDMGFNHIF